MSTRESGVRPSVPPVAVSIPFETTALPRFRPELADVLDEYARRVLPAPEGIHARHVRGMAERLRGATDAVQFVDDVEALTDFLDKPEGKGLASTGAYQHLVRALHKTVFDAARDRRNLGGWAVTALRHGLDTWAVRS